MLNFLRVIIVKLKVSNPKLYYFLVSIARRFFTKRLGIYPRILANEKRAVYSVLQSSQWNMCDGKGLVHEKLEERFSEYVHVPYAVAVGSGGVALQMSMRALGLKPGDEVIHQVDTCSATAMSIMNAGVTPIFADISKETFMLDVESVRRSINKNTKAILITHMWGNPENTQKLVALAKEHGLKIIEDGCLALGAISNGRPVGNWGDVGVFSFGASKPIQGGEGGMIVTHDLELARELRAMRHWGDRSFEFGERDVTQLSWNGRLSEIVAAVVLEQLSGYPSHIRQLQDAVSDFEIFLKNNVEGLSINLGTAEKISDSVFTQVQLKIDENSKLSKDILWKGLKSSGIPIWHANFELITSLSLFKNKTWKDFILRGDIENVELNYSKQFENANSVFVKEGLGLNKMNYLSNQNFSYLKKELLKICSS